MCEQYYLYYGDHRDVVKRYKKVKKYIKGADYNV